MFDWFFRALLITLVLACPAWGGRCCAHPGDVEQVSPPAKVCGTCCCQQPEFQPATLPTDTPPPQDDCPNRCHDCFCTGALPVGPSPTQCLDEVVVATVTPQPLTIDRLEGRSRSSVQDAPCHWPPEMGRRLATLCTLLI
ncbi:hypothetical protein FYK55_02140 [Roseiconus nitratireducens]|uniref:Secreted protein n=1 Tax=Roseiconus nitratireducens TaxID=2605748 RepID=A0A5M6DIB9_9BACT|nr:hypothetical protein [Roseiconus nitratireducens]KAA5547223.1 hypothetical protein FYK55_02140 [Roseiconus nitratireducens]